MNIQTVLSKLHLSKVICDNVICKDHSMAHRCLVGIAVGFIGVVISKAGAHTDYIAVHIFGDMVGYALHGIGTVPFIELLSSSNA